jgi:serine protease Do
MDNNFNSNNMSSANINPGTPDIENNGYNGQVQNTSDNGQVTDNSQMFSQQAGEPQINAKAPEGVGQPYTFYQVQQGEKVDEKKKKAKKKKVKKPMTFGRVFSVGLALMLVTVLINTGILYGVLEYTDWGRSANDNRNVVVGTTLQNGTAEVTGTSTGTSNGEYTVADIAKMVKPSVVSITNTSIVDQNYNPFYGGSGQYQVKGAGSGIIIGINDKELLIVTNNHVVEDSVSLSVQFINDKTIDTAYVKGTNSTSDIAVVGIPIDDLDDDTLNAIKVATLGSSDDLSEGDQVVAIGNALGYGQSVTVGYVSAKNRTITINNNDMVVIQTDAAINGGNSGGALINMKGEVIGINVAKSSSSSLSSTSVEGMGYAIPISDATATITKLMNTEKKEQYSEDERGYIGITAITVDSQTAASYNIPVGAYVRSVTENSPADKAGITTGSVIVAVDDNEVTTANELVEQLSYYKAGAKVKIKVYIPSGREYTEKTVEVKLVAKGSAE